MEKNTDALSRVLTETFGRKYSYLTNRGTSAIYASLRAVTKPGDEVVLPAITCPDVLYAVLYARLKPILCDIRSDNYTIDLASMEEHVSDRTKAIIAVHLFGHPCRIDEICEFARRKTIIVLEDIAQSIGTTYKGKPTGTFGDIVILSFGKDKIIDGGGGGAVLTDESQLADRVQTYFRFHKQSIHYNSIYEIYRKIYYSIIEFEQFSPGGAHELLKELPFIFRDLYFYKTPSLNINGIIEGFKNLREMKCIRRKNATKYQELLKHPAILHPRINLSDNIYRYSILLPNRALRDKTVTALRSNGFHASTLYPSLHSFLYSTRPKWLPTATKVSERILNLWVAPGLPRRYIKSSSQLILQVLKDDS
jgi:dTDP-4-amino-4,6-dideoxygalactose transaminase